MIRDVEIGMDVSDVNRVRRRRCAGRRPIMSSLLAEYSTSAGQLERNLHDPFLSRPDVSVNKSYSRTWRYVLPFRLVPHREGSAM